MEKGPSGFTATVRVPWEQKVLYKFIVDGRWTTIDKAPTEVDWRGYINNVYNAPTRPKIDTPRYEPPGVQEPKIAPVPAPVPVEEKKETPTPAPQPTEKGSVEVPAKPEKAVKDQTPTADRKEPSPPVDKKEPSPPVDQKEPSPPVDKKVTPSVPGVTPVPVVTVKDTPIPVATVKDTPIPVATVKDTKPVDTPAKVCLLLFIASGFTNTLI